MSTSNIIRDNNSPAAQDLVVEPNLIDLDEVQMPQPVYQVGLVLPFNHLRDQAAGARQRPVVEVGPRARATISGCFSLWRDTILLQYALLNLVYDVGFGGYHLTIIALALLLRRGLSFQSWAVMNFVLTHIIDPRQYAEDIYYYVKSLYYERQPILVETREHFNWILKHRPDLVPTLRLTWYDYLTKLFEQCFTRLNMEIGAVLIFTFVIIYCIIKLYRKASLKGDTTPVIISEETLLEAMQPGSELKEIVAPYRHQATLHMKSATSYVGIGQCFFMLVDDNIEKVRNKFCLVTAAHVIHAATSAEFVYIEGERGMEKIAIDQFTISCPDIAFAIIEQSLFNKFGKTCIKPTAVDDHAYVIVSTGTKKSTGRVTINASEFGTLKYQGSTINGFSGAPYMVGSRFVGMHVGSVAGNNVGIAANYVYCVVRKIVSVKPESTAEWLMENVRKNKRNMTYRIAGDDIYVQVGANFYSFDRDDKGVMEAIKELGTERYWKGPSDFESAKVSEPFYQDSKNLYPAVRMLIANALGVTDGQS